MSLYGLTIVSQCHENITVVNTIAERLKDAREKAQMTQPQLAASAGVSAGTIGNIEAGTRRNPRELLAIARAVRVNPQWLLDGTGPRASLEAAESNVSPLIKQWPPVPLVSWVQAGQWTEIGGEFAAGDAEDWLPCPDSHSPLTFALKVQGVSMEPEFKSGTIIFVDPAKAADNLSYVVVRMENENTATFKQLVVEGSRRYLRPLNPNWPDQIIEINGNAVICGVVVGEYRKR